MGKIGFLLIMLLALSATQIPTASAQTPVTDLGTLGGNFSQALGVNAHYQPLHSTTRVSATDLDGDDGGNGVKLTSPANLHTFWDGLLGGGDAPSTALNAILTLQDAPESAVNDLPTVIADRLRCFYVGSERELTTWRM